MDDKAGLRTVPRELTRGQVAELLGIPESDVGRMDGRLLHPVRTGDRRWLYELTELRALLDRSNGTSGGKPIVSGETTAQVFELFEAGKTLAQAVIATQQTADTIMHLRAQYDRMAGTMVLSSETVLQASEGARQGVSTRDPRRGGADRASPNVPGGPGGRGRAGVCPGLEDRGDETDPPASATCERRRSGRAHSAWRRRVRDGAAH
jgi:hypothetical protein